MISKITDQIFETIIIENNLCIFYQPIVSLDKEKVIGYEALLRVQYENEPIHIENLFNYARKSNRVKKLDYASRELSLNNFCDARNDTILFLNFEASLLHEYMSNSNSILSFIKSLGIEYQRIVIEINEKNVTNNDILLEFLELFRSEGFLIALDDVGAGYSNLNRIAIVKPDIVKIDRLVISDIHKDYYKSEIVRAITSLSLKIGAITLAEGVETEEELCACLSVGVSLFQGYYFSKAIPMQECLHLNYRNVFDLVSKKFKMNCIEDIKERTGKGGARREMLSEISLLLKEACTNDYESVLLPYINQKESIECVYVLDINGMQLTPTIFKDRVTFRNNYLFSPSLKEDYHIVKPYYYVAMHKKHEVYISEKYISLATGNFCETYSITCTDRSGNDLIICLDFMVL